MVSTENRFNLKRCFFRPSVRKNYSINLLLFGVKLKNLDRNEQGETTRKVYGVIMYASKVLNLSRTDINLLYLE